MVRREVLTREDVFDAAGRLKVMGKQVTALKILAMLGGGSLTTIYKYLEQWEATNTPAKLVSTEDEIPPEVMKMFGNVWTSALSAAERYTPSAEKDAQLMRLNELVSIVQDERDKALQREARLLGQIDALKSANEKLLSRLEKKLR
jgi:hypothetical protein